MKHLSILLITLLFAIPSFADQAHSESTAANPTKLVISRAKESSKTRGLQFAVMLDNLSIGKLKSNQSKTIELEEGSHSVYSTLPNSEELVFEASSGQTIFIEAVVTKKAGKYRMNFKPADQAIAKK